MSSLIVNELSSTFLPPRAIGILLAIAVYYPMVWLTFNVIFIDQDVDKTKIYFQYIYLHFRYHMKSVDLDARISFNFPVFFV